ncbi:unnamed protein product [Coccothraustes coccothraustes]
MKSVHLLDILGIYTEEEEETSVAVTDIISVARRDLCIIGHLPQGRQAVAPQ